jgi:hypothetical protein
MKKTIAVVALLICGVAAGQERGPSTPEERATAVRLARALEADPLGDHAKEARQWLTVWLIAIPDITVPLCGEFLGPVPRGAKKFSSELVVQQMYSSAAFIIEHPGQATDTEAIYQAGLLGVLRAYEAIRSQNPRYTWPFLDELVAKRDGDELTAHVHASAEKCK